MKTTKIPRAIRWFSAIALFFTPIATMLDAAHATEAPAAIRIVALGDSLTAGYMLKPNESFPAQLEMALHGKGHKVQVHNAGVSGDTTAGGLERLDWALDGGADAVIVELGANDALRGLPPEQAKANLDKILARVAERGADILLAGMKAPGNWGGEYQRQFDALFPALAEKHQTALYPFLLDGVALNSQLIMSDGLHPTADGVAEIVKRILPDVEKLIARVQARKSAAAAK